MFKELKISSDRLSNSKISKKVEQIKSLFYELEQHNLTTKSLSNINESIELLNQSYDNDKALLKSLKKQLNCTMQTVLKHDKLSTKNHYRNQWLALGMTVFGIPMGAAFGAVLVNMGFLGLGIPIGMAIGAGMDKKAKDEGRQLEFSYEM